MIKYLTIDQKEDVLRLASQVEDLFGKMVGVFEFESALEQCLKSKAVIGCISGNEVCGAGIIDKNKNEIAWLVVDSSKRGLGIGKMLMDQIIVELDTDRAMYVRTFADGIPEGKAARALYTKYGFVENADGGKNPAGVPTKIMVKENKKK